MEITIIQLLDRMEDQGYKRLSPGTIHNYRNAGLLPRTRKTGGPRKGVYLLFLDGDKAEAQLKSICSLKGKGFTMIEIKWKLNGNWVEIKWNFIVDYNFYQSHRKSILQKVNFQLF